MVGTYDRAEGYEGRSSNQVMCLKRDQKGGKKRQKEEEVSI